MSRFSDPLPVVANGAAPVIINVPQLRMFLAITDSSVDEQRTAIAEWLKTHEPTPALRRSIERFGWADLLNPAA